MADPVQAYARLRLNRAQEELATAQENIDNGRYRVAVSRAYYAIFYVASAALFSQAVERAKHSGVESAFGQILIKGGHIEPEYGRIYQQARRQREEADYADTAIDKAVAQQVVADAERFVERMERFLHSVGAL